MKSATNHDTISLRRRQLMIAGLAGVASPAVVFAGQFSGAARDALAADLADGVIGGGGKLVISGRILGAPDAMPLSGALIEVLLADENGERAVTTTDADGRFMFTTMVPLAQRGRSQHLDCSVSDAERGTVVTQLYFAHEPGISGDRIAQLQRDDMGVWRASFGLTLFGGDVHDS
ncbi:MAG: hypothetical protein HY017_32775 [Betaproteobacteria bacterium]|nr:hypothetical protein [Betaproteobacteria bacterium]